MNNPEWCNGKDCTCIYSMNTAGGGQCIGRLLHPTDHITKEANTMQWCHYDSVPKKIIPFHINLEDCIVDVYLIGEALRKIGLGLPQAIVDNMPVSG